MTSRGEIYILVCVGSGELVDFLEGEALRAGDRDLLLEGDFLPGDLERDLLLKADSLCI